MKQIIGLKDLRQNIDVYIRKIQNGDDFVVVRKSKPVFQIGPITDMEAWERVVDFTKIKKGGVELKDLLARL